ncbi:MAG: DNA-binding response regulator [Bacteroidetes bacterium]|nr:MAG: DNA-binding response regulator [Bacteroidota bacterium]
MLRAILVDDEPLALESLQQDLQTHCAEQVQVVGAFESPVKALKAIQSLRPDLLFLDIGMEQYELDGFELLEILAEQACEVIFVSGHTERAAQAFKANAVDFLVKPFLAEELKAAVEKVMYRKSKPDEALLRKLVDEIRQPTAQQARQLHFPVVDGLVLVHADQIMYCRAEGQLTRVFRSEDSPFVTYQIIGKVEELLPADLFFRIHHSHIINRHFLKKYLKGSGGVVQMADGTTLNVAKSRKRSFLDWLRTQTNQAPP